MPKILFLLLGALAALVLTLGVADAVAIVSLSAGFLAYRKLRLG